VRRGARIFWSISFSSFAIISAMIAFTRPDGTHRTPCTTSAAKPFKIVSANVWKGNATPTAAATWIMEQQADLVVLIEAKQRSEPILDALRSTFPYQVDCHARAPCSTYVLMRSPPIAVRQLGRGDVENRESLSALIVDVPTKQGAVTIAAAHLSRPWPIGRQEREVRTLEAALLRDRPVRNLVIIGDFNTINNYGAIGQVQRSLGVLPLAGVASWPSGWPLLPLDRVLLSSDWGGYVSVGPEIGSDHRPLVATLCRESDRSSLYSS
jgi:endonuclease/exonuclease/phosphatase (EEP) superfamily protein YafD